jgi:hypothetical protein
MSSRITVKFEVEGETQNFFDKVIADPTYGMGLWIKPEDLAEQIRAAVEFSKLPETFEVRHLRNIEVAENGSTSPTDTGGYTVASDGLGNLYISKCHPKSDKFSRSRGLAVCMHKYVFRNLGIRKGSWTLRGFESTGINQFKAVVRLGL